MAYTPPNINGQATSANSAPVVIASDQSVIKTKLANDIASTAGTFTTSTSVVTATNLVGIGSATIQISGTYAGINAVFEVSVDGTNWVSIPASTLASANPIITLNTGVLTNSLVVYNISPLLGASALRIRNTAYTSGTANILIMPSAQFTQYTNNTIITSGSISSIASSVTPGVAAANLGKSEDAVHTTGDTGVAVWAVRNDNAATVHTSGNGDYSPFSTDSFGTQFVRQAPAPTATITQVTPATTSTTIKASNAARKALIIVNGGTSDCYIAYGATASSTAYTFLLPSLATTTIRGEEYSGIVTGIWTATGGNSMQITEIV